MQLTIIKKNKLNIFVLPEIISGNHWITDFENGKKTNLISIEANNNVWNLISNDEAFLIDQNEIMIPSVVLKEHSFYLIKNNYKNEKYYLYCSPVVDNTYMELSFPTNNILTVGSSDNNNLCFRLNGVGSNSFSVEKNNNIYHINVNNENELVYVNKKRVAQTKKLNYGDIIFILGLKLVLMKRDGRDYLIVNNPNNQLLFNSSLTNVVSKDNTFVEKYEELSEEYLNDSNDYFYRTPYFYKAVTPYIVNIDEPPSKKEDSNTPAILTIGPMLTTSMTSVVMLLSTMSNVKNGVTTIANSTTTIVMCAVMIASTLLWPTITKSFQKRNNKKFEAKRQRLYRKYVDKVDKEIQEELEKQKGIILGNNYSINDCIKIIKEHSSKLWQRRIMDDDFLNLPVGMGNVEMKLDIKYPEEHFTMDDDSLLEVVHELGNKERIITNVPITYSFYNNISTGLIGNSIINKEFIDRIVLQIMTNYSYDEIKIVTLTSIDNEENWDYIKTLPHSWSNDKKIRFFGSSNEDYREIFYVLEKIYNERRKKNTNNNSLKESPHYIIITDATKSIDSYDLFKNIMSSSISCGFSIIMAVDKITALPNECKNFINVRKEECNIYNSIINADSQKFVIDFSSTEDIYDCARELANIKVEIKNESENELPSIYHFLEMFQVGKVDQLNCFERWKKSNPILSLQTPLGIGKSGEIITLDLHEKYHGPHGLIAGTTGSGKSELIVTYILSLAINYHPDEVQIILIDYKGGSLAGAFVNDNYRLPHIAGTITNLDGNELNRSLASIESEIQRRQRVFNEAKIISNESTMDIYKYQKLYREGRLKTMDSVAHLFIISDEFAELKEQQPEFMDKLVSAARVGRSLGIHLILATQKPSGIVNAQIWSNTRFRICLKVQDSSDSQEVIKKPDAAYLKGVGRFLLQVGYDEVYTLGQCAWAGGQYYPNTTFKKKIDSSVNSINNIGFVTTSKESVSTTPIKSMGDALSNVVRYISDVATENKISIRKLWLDKIPALIYIDSLKNKYSFKKNDYYLNPIIGEFDDPSNQNQFLLNVPFSKIGNSIVYGMTGSGKEEFLSTLVYSLISTYSVEELNMYLLDFGSETLQMYKNAPQVGDVVLINDSDKIINLLKMIEYEMNIRKNLFVSYEGNYQSFIKNSEKKLPNILIFINNFEAFNENYEDEVDRLTIISRDAYKYGIFIIMSATNDNGVRTRIKQNFNLVYVLQQSNDMDYASMLGAPRNKIPAKIKGRGLFKRDNVYEFQTASIKNVDNISQFINEYCKQLRMNSKESAKRIPSLPKVVDYSYIKDSLDVSSNVVVGVDKESIQIEKYNFSKYPINILSSYEIDYSKKFINSLVNELSFVNYYQTIFINASDVVFNSVVKPINSNFDNILNNVFDYVNKTYELYQNNNYNTNSLKNQKKLIIVIYGINTLITKIKPETKSQFEEIMNKANQTNMVSFIFVDIPEVIKNYIYESWFKNNSDLSKGIWIGSGIVDQSLFRITKYDKQDREEIPNTYGYIINNGKINRIKLLDEFEPKK